MATFDTATWDEAIEDDDDGQVPPAVAVSASTAAAAAAAAAVATSTSSSGRKHVRDPTPPESPVVVARGHTKRSRLLADSDDSGGHDSGAAAVVTNDQKDEDLFGDDEDDDDEDDEDIFRDFPSVTGGHSPAAPGSGDEDDDDDRLGGVMFEGPLHSDDSESDSDGARVGGAHERHIPEAEEDSGGTSATPSVRGQRLIDARPFARESMNPPMLRVKVGKTRNTRIDLILCGDLVTQITSPLFVFRLRVHPSNCADVDSPYFVDEIVDVISGPAKKAENEAKERVDLLGHPEVSFTVDAGDEGAAGAAAAVVVPAPLPPQITIRMIRGALVSHGYFAQAHDRKTFVNGVMKPLIATIPGAAVVGGNTHLIVDQEALDRFASPSAGDQFAWAVRNAHMSVAFFKRANLVGGAGVRALESATLVKTGGTAAAWRMIEGTKQEQLDDPELDGPMVLEIVEVILFAGRIDERRRFSLLQRLNVGMTADVQAECELLVRAADIYHRLPPCSNVSAASSCAVWGDAGEPWPEKMCDVLKAHDVFTQRRTEQNRWFACWKVAQEYYDNASNIMDNDAVTFVRADRDDDDDDVSDGYITYLLSLAKKHAPHIMVITTNEGRARFLRRTAEIHRWMRASLYKPSFVGAADTIIIDRAHQLDGDTLLAIVRSLIVDVKVKKVVVCGSLLATRERGVASMFATLYRQIETGKRKDVTTGLSNYKIAVGKDPTTISEENAPSHILGGATIFTLSTKAGTQTTATLGGLQKLFPHAVITTPYKHITERGWTAVPVAIVILDPNWTREDLAVVWQCTKNAVNIVWFAGPSAHTWRDVMTRPAHGRPLAGAALG